VLQLFFQSFLAAEDEEDEDEDEDEDEVEEDEADALSGRKVRRYKSKAA
jgi:hypothetical protein